MARSKCFVGGPLGAPVADDDNRIVARNRRRRVAELKRAGGETLRPGVGPGIRGGVGPGGSAVHNGGAGDGGVPGCADADDVDAPLAGQRGADFSAAVALAGNDGGDGIGLGGDGIIHIVGMRGADTGGAAGVVINRQSPCVRYGMG